MKLFAAAALVLLTVSPAAARDLPKMADKALYCSAVYYAAAAVIFREDADAAYNLRGYARNWLDISLGLRWASTGARSTR